LIDQCLLWADLTVDELQIIDPACGSGIFLQECLRELASREFSGQVRLKGIDNSPISAEIAQFCIHHSIRDLGPRGNARAEIQQLNALRSDWGNPHLVLMNPPFSSYTDMSLEDRESCRDVLGDLARGHFDKAMAFIWKAICDVRPGGLVASVLPSSLLESDHGRRWRSAIAECAHLTTVGRFKGYSYFQDAIVEPAFLVLKKKTDPAGAVPQVTIVEAEENAEDIAMRKLRKAESSVSADVLLVLDCPQPPASRGWMPRGFRNQRLLTSLSASASTVGDLFQVRQGALTGNNNIFVLSVHEWATLSAHERAFFHPAAGTSTIWDGQLLKTQYVFYPHGVAGATLEREEDVRHHLPTYYAQRLLPAKHRLLRRRDKNEANWWTLTEHRAWQATFPPKLVSAYFGAAGKFSFDSDGVYVCVHGYAWLWKGGCGIGNAEEAVDDEERVIQFTDTEIPWAYTAILNSRLFDILLACFCPRVQGGQFNLSKRFVRMVPLPDLMSGRLTGDLIDALAAAGKRLGRGADVDGDELASLVARAYGVALDRWQPGDTVE
jgi:hypothetical protein